MKSLCRSSVGPRPRKGASGLALFDTPLGGGRENGLGFDAPVFLRRELRSSQVAARPPAASPILGEVTVFHRSIGHYSFWFAAFSATLGRAADAPRQPVPAPVVQRAALATIHEAYAEEFRTADRPLVARDLAKTLLGAPPSPRRRAQPTSCSTKRGSSPSPPATRAWRWKLASASNRPSQ